MALACAGAVLYAVGSVLWRSGFFLPKWIPWENASLYAQPLSGEIELKHKSVRITHNDSLIWASPDNLKIQQVLSCDIDHDREEELILLCWKRGRYGSYRPFWVKEDEKQWSQHIFVYEYQQGEIAPKWMSSYLGQDVAHMDFAPGSSSATNQEIRNSVADDPAWNHSAGSHSTDNPPAFQHTAARTADNIKFTPGRLLLTDTDGLVSSWVWDSWGFTRQDTEVSFAVFGDNLLHESIYRYGLYHDPSFGFLFENVKALIADSDISVMNQETPFTDIPSDYSGYPRFGTPAGVGQAIADAGFEVVTCATNHALDQGPYGIQVTKDFFDSHDILCLGIQTENETAYRPYEIVRKNGIRFALLNYTYGTNGIKIPEENPNMVHLLDDEEKIRNDIKSAGNKADFIIVFVHWGTENSSDIDEFQKKWTQLFLESKVDVVVGTHPHTLQPCELLKDEAGHEMLVYYSIGNFISAQPENSCVKGGMASFTVSPTSDGYKVTEYGLLPLCIVRESDGKYTVKLKV